MFKDIFLLNKINSRSCFFILCILNSLFNHHSEITRQLEIAKQQNKPNIIQNVIK